MKDQNSDPYRRGRYSSGFNASSDDRTSSDKLRDLDSRTSRLPENDRKLVQSIRTQRLNSFHALLKEQEGAHAKEWQKKCNSYLQEGVGFDLEHTSPKLRRQIAEERATHFMATKENYQQEKHVKMSVRQIQGFVEAAEEQLARSSKQAQHQNTNGGRGR